MSKKHSFNYILNILKTVLNKKKSNTVKIQKDTVNGLTNFRKSCIIKLLLERNSLYR